MSFEPVISPKSRILIVGTWPSPKSREQGFYYGHPQNRFWPLLAGLFGLPVPESIAEKKSLILSNGLALWDTLASCTIAGAADSTIENETPNDIAALCAETGIEKVLCNGKTAYNLYNRFNPKGPAGIYLPSTSPANAAWSLARLAGAWGEYLRPKR